jgi:Major Facilitator Superfamily
MADEETGRSEGDPLLSSSDNGADRPPEMSPVGAYLTIATLTVLTLVGSMSTGLLNISIPRIQEDLQLPEEFMLWYVRVNPSNGAPTFFPDRSRVARLSMLTDLEMELQASFHLLVSLNPPSHCAPFSCKLLGIREKTDLRCGAHRLVCGCCMLLAGSIADFVGSRVVNLVGTLILGVSLGTAGLSQTGIQMIVSRGFQGLGVSMCFPTAISILSLSFPTGRIRSVGFACLGLGQPLGFSLGLVLGGVFETLYGGWRSGFYLSGLTIIIITIMNLWLLPKNRFREKKLSFRGLRSEIDWLGVLISSACLGILSYIMAYVTPICARCGLLWVRPWC